MKNTITILQQSPSQNPDKILHEKFIKYGANAKEWIRKCILLLPEIQKREIWRKKGFSCIYEYAAKLAGMSHNTVDDALRILRKIEDKPQLLKIVEEKGINSVRPIITIATTENAAFWAEKAKNMSVNTLRVYRRELFENSQIGDVAKSKICVLSGNVPEFQPEKSVISMELDPETAQELEKLKGEKNWNELMKEFLQMRKKSLEVEKAEIIKAEIAKSEVMKPETVKSEAVKAKSKKKPLEIKKSEVLKAKSRPVPAKIEKFVLKRANNQCEFPNCTKHYEILHHTERFALKKDHNPDKIVALCREHERIAHLGLIENEEMPPQYWKIRKEPDKTDIKFMIDQRVAEYRKK